MSYDLMVFEPKSAPDNRKDFMDWFREQTEWSEEHGYNDPSVSSSALRKWFMEMKNAFPPMNGPFSPSDDELDAMDEDEESHVTDYSVGKSVIYAAFAWSMAEEAGKTMRALAQKHGVGFFDVSSDDGEILLPDGSII